MGGSAKHQTAFSKYPEIDLTVAHIDLEITTVRPLDFVQVWSDGQMDGITLKIGTQSNQALDIKQVASIRLTDNPEKVYFSNDVRQGRSKAIIYFVRGDFPLQLTTSGGGISLAELAVRNGSISTFDRRGNIIWQDSFEENLNRWQQNTVGLSIISLTSALARTGSVSAKLYNPAASRPTLTKMVPFASQTKFGFEISFGRDIGGITANAKIMLGLSAYDGANIKVGQLIYYESTTSLYYLDSAGNEILLSNAIPIDSAMDFNTIKLVTDPINNKYVRGLFNAFSFDLRNIHLFTGASLLSAMLECEVHLDTCDGVNPATIYVDDGIITRDE